MKSLGNKKKTKKQNYMRSSLLTLLLVLPLLGYGEVNGHPNCALVQMDYNGFKSPELHTVVISTTGNLNVNAMDVQHVDKEDIEMEFSNLKQRRKKRSGPHRRSYLPNGRRSSTHRRMNRQKTVGYNRRRYLSLHKSSSVMIPSRTQRPIHPILSHLVSTTIPHVLINHEETSSTHGMAIVHEKFDHASLTRQNVAINPEILNGSSDSSLLMAIEPEKPDNCSDFSCHITISSEIFMDSYHSTREFESSDNLSLHNASSSNEPSYFTISTQSIDTSLEETENFTYTRPSTTVDRENYNNSHSTRKYVSIDAVKFEDSSKSISRFNIDNENFNDSSDSSIQITIKPEMCENCSDSSFHIINDERLEDSYDNRSDITNDSMVFVEFGNLSLQTAIGIEKSNDLFLSTSCIAVRPEEFEDFFPSTPNSDIDTVEFDENSYLNHTKVVFLDISKDNNDTNETHWFDPLMYSPTIADTPTLANISTPITKNTVE